VQTRFTYRECGGEVFSTASESSTPGMTGSPALLQSNSSVDIDGTPKNRLIILRRKGLRIKTVYLRAEPRTVGYRE
jgi:hypothetical protein